MELTNTIVKPLLVISEKSWHLGEVPLDWRKINVTPCLHEGGSGEIQASQPHLDVWEDNGKNPPGNNFQS